MLAGIFDNIYVAIDPFLLFIGSKVFTAVVYDIL